MTRRKSTLTVLAGSLLLSAPTLQAAPTDNQWQAFSKAAVREHIIPRYQQLTDSSAQLSASIAQFCQQPNTSALADTRQQFHNTMAAWQGIQHVQFGPVEILMRNFSLQFWPDKKNLTSKQLNTLLSEENPYNLTPDYFRGASIAVKGLPALERLLFGNAPLSPYGCQLTHAIANNVAMMTASIDLEWQSQQLPRIDAAPDGSDYYEDSTEAATELMKALVEPVEVIRDLKLLRPLHKSASRAKPRRAESWRSERSLQNIRLNLAALAEIYRGDNNASVKALLINEGQSDLAETIDKHFGTLDTQLAAVKMPLYKAVKDEQAHQQLRAVSDQLKVLHKELEEAMLALDIQLGFNSRDGD